MDAKLTLVMPAFNEVKTIEELMKLTEEFEEKQN